MAKKTQIVRHVYKRKSGSLAAGKKQGIYTTKMALRGVSELVKIVGIGVPVSDARKLYRRYKVDVKEFGGYVSGSPAKYKKHARPSRISRRVADVSRRLDRS